MSKWWNQLGLFWYLLSSQLLILDTTYYSFFVWICSWEIFITSGQLSIFSCYISKYGGISDFSVHYFISSIYPICSADVSWNDLKWETFCKMSLKTIEVLGKLWSLTPAKYEYKEEHTQFLQLPKWNQGFEN